MTATAEKPGRSPTAHKKLPKAIDITTTRKLLPWLVAIALFMEALDATILNTAVPTIAAALHVPPLSMKSALTSYMISLAVFIPVSGWFADRFGTRRVFFSAILLFTLGSLLCGLSVNMTMLIAARILQGCGGALMLPVGRIAMVRTFPRSDLLRAMSFVAIPGLIGPLIGPLAGGFIVAYFHWSVIFFVNLPMGLLGFLFAFRYMPDYRAKRKEPLDIIGLTLFGSGISILSYVLEVFGEHSMDLRSELFLFAVSIVLLVAYGFHAPRIKFPLLRIRLFRIRTFRAAVVGSFITRLGIGGMPFLLPLLYQVGLGYTALQSGLLIMPQTLAAIGLRPLMTRLINHFGYRRILLSNTVIIGCVIMLFTFVSPGTPVWIIVILALCIGFFSILQYTSMGSLTFADVPDEHASMGSSIASTVQQMSMSFGVALSSLAILFFVGGDRAPGDVHMIAGIHHTFIAMGLFTILTSLTFWQLKPNDGASVSRHESQEPAAEG
ncbi:MAG TPA: DHA2 family efflux MFS transporter permease subunit [Phycisphaerales bacterium]|nr:DHA2 family efflux MFS transporter permease subunit [Phycisphaerales bacterium]